MICERDHHAFGIKMNVKMGYIRPYSNYRAGPNPVLEFNVTISVKGLSL
jgi:hypothetical protein